MKGLVCALQGFAACIIITWLVLAVYDTVAPVVVEFSQPKMLSEPVLYPGAEYDVLRSYRKLHDKPGEVSVSLRCTLENEHITIRTALSTLELGDNVKKYRNRVPEHILPGQKCYQTVVFQHRGLSGLVREDVITPIEFSIVSRNTYMKMRETRFNQGTF